MDDYTTDAFANRDEPIPLLTVSYSDVDTSSSEIEDKRRRRHLRKLSPSRLKKKITNYNAAQAEKPETTPEVKASLQDRLFAKVLQQVIPTEEIDDEGDGPTDKRSSKYVARPAFSLPLMTNNFRRFNARIGIVFVFQSRLIRLFSWRTPTHTLSFLVTYTFVCLDPPLLLVLPLVVILLFIMVPAFLSRHPPPPTTQTVATTSSYYTDYTGPALAPARTIKPAAETSKDFFRNMRDLQNAMADFSVIHDTLVSFIAPATNFSDEILSSTVFLFLFLLTTALFISAQLLPFRIILLLAGYVLVISGHPSVQIWLVKQQKRAERRRALALSAAPGTDSKQYTSIPGLPFTLPPIPPHLQSLFTSLSTITLSTIPETREVEIFELQHRPLSSSLNPQSSGAAAEWQPHLFMPTPYDPLSPARIAGDRPKGTRFFEDVQPPEGWEWAGKKWELDLEAGEWVAERLVVGVEYDVLSQRRQDDEDQDDHDDDANDQDQNIISFSDERRRRQSVNGEFGGWVWDLPPAPGSGGRDEEVWLAYGDYEIPKDDEAAKKGKRDSKAKKEKTKDWEEAMRYGAGGRTGEWRRRRWVRLVKRKQILEYSR